MRTNKEKLAKVEELIKSAHGAVALKELTQLHKKGLKTEELLMAASYATRANSPELAIRILHPLIHPTSKVIRPPTDAEKAEYALALLRSGAYAECALLLKKVSVKEVPKVLLYKALLKLSEWNYAEAIPFLKEYIREPRITSYERLVGKINLVPCLITENHLPEAKVYLTEVLEETSDQKLFLLNAIAMRYLGNLEIQRKNWEGALTHFESAETLLKDFPGLELYFARKWSAIARVFISKGSRESIRDLELIRAEATTLQHWESHRDIDFHLALFKGEKENFLGLYRGTPWPEYRKRILKEMGEVPPGAYAWKITVNLDQKDFQQVDLLKGAEKLAFKGGQVLHRLYHTLLSDHYREFSLGMLFEKLFPGEFYDPKSSQYRIHQPVRRLRAWFKKNSIPLTIENSAGGYKLRAERNCEIIIRPETSAVSLVDYRLELIRTKLGGEFSTAEATSLLQMERRNAAHLLKTAVDQGFLVKKGKAMHTRYAFVSDSSPKKAA